MINSVSVFHNIVKSFIIVHINHNIIARLSSHHSHKLESMNNKLNNPPQGSTTDAPVGIPPAVASKMPAANESAAEDAGEESDKFSSTNAVFVECAAGKFCKAHHSMANLATCQSAHNCFNCAKKIHRPYFVERNGQL